MSILFRESEKFEKDIKSFQEKEREQIVLKINLYCADFENNPKLFRKNSYRPLKILLPENEKSSLYVLRINKDIRVILTLEDDPLFNQTVITLLRVVRHDSIEKAFRGMIESLYQGRAIFGQGD